MPELPDVESFRAVADDVAVGRRVVGVRVPDDRVLRTTSPQGLGRALHGARLEGTERHGKWLWLRTDARSDLLLHFGMTGGLHAHDRGDAPCQHDRLLLDLAPRSSAARGPGDRGGDGPRLALQMQRLLGGAWLVRRPQEAREVTGALGPDALGLDGDDLRDLLGGSRAGLKSALMDQERLAGLGNEIADEACWQARVHPGTPCDDLDDRTFDALADALGRVLDVGIDLGQVPRADGFLNDVREDEDPHCPRCGTALARDTIAGRTTWWCPEDQPTLRRGRGGSPRASCG